MGLISSSWAGDHSCSQHSWLAGTDCDPHTAAGVCGSQIIPNQIIPNMRNWRSEQQTIILYNLNLSVSIKYNWSNITKCFSKYIDYYYYLLHYQNMYLNKMYHLSTLNYNMHISITLFFCFVFVQKSCKCYAGGFKPISLILWNWHNLAIILCASPRSVVLIAPWR